MIANSAMKHKPKAMVGTMGNIVPDFVNVNEKVLIKCKLNPRKQFKTHYLL